VFAGCSASLSSPLLRPALFASKPWISMATTPCAARSLGT
jgi:hypothetical protein